MAEAIVRAEHLTKVFRQRGGGVVRAADDVSFVVERGEWLGLTGVSGSGKSTVASLLARLTDPTRGRILFEGQDITALRGRRLRPVYRKLQMVFQTPVRSFDPRQTLGGAVAESLINSGSPRAESGRAARELLEQCGLPGELAERFPHEVSGGQCQRAAIARALAPRPSLIILDEATAALDVTVQREILELLGELRGERGLTFLMISHDLALMASCCSRVLVMRAGRIVEEGPAAEVIRHPREACTRQLTQSVLRIPAPEK